LSKNLKTLGQGKLTSENEHKICIFGKSTPEKKKIQASDKHRLNEKLQISS
jgi:hypothetical protein